MDKEYITFFKSNFKTKISNKSLIQYVKDANKINEDYEPLLHIRQLLWNEIDFLETDHPLQWLFDAIFFWKTSFLTMVDLKALVHRLSDLELISTEDIYDLSDIILDTKLESLENWLGEIWYVFDDLISLVPDLSIAIQVYSKIYNSEIDSYWSDLASQAKSLRERPEYTEDLLKMASISTLHDLSNWVDADSRERIVNYGLSKSLDSDFDPKDNQSILFDDIEFPLSFPVLGDRIQEIGQTILDSKEFEGIPQKHLNSWMPKFVYSRPDVKQKIRIYFPGGKDIGHSGILIKTNEGALLFDFGLSVVNNTFANWHPLLEKLDAVFLSHAHLDHSGGLPLLMRDERKLQWFGKRETGILCEMLWNDTTKIASRISDNYLKTSNLGHIAKASNVLNAMSNFNEIELGKPLKVLPKVEITPFNASHLFGSVGFEINIDGRRLFYTGDFNLDNMEKQNTKFPTDIDQLIFDGTYYNRESTFSEPQDTLKEVLDNSKRIIIPAFSMGRSQEMLFELKNLKAEKKWKIVLTGMGGRLASKLKMSVGPSGGGKKTGVVIANTLNPDDFGENTIVIAGQGMLQAGTSRNLLDATREDTDTSIVLCGYQAPNSLGFHLHANHPYLRGKYHQPLYRVRISGHSSSDRLNSYLDRVSSTKVMVHSPEEARKNIIHENLVIPTRDGLTL